MILNCYYFQMSLLTQKVLTSVPHNSLQNPLHSNNIQSSRLQHHCVVSGIHATWVHNAVGQATRGKAPSRALQVRCDA